MNFHIDIKKFVKTFLYSIKREIKQT